MFTHIGAEHILAYKQTSEVFSLIRIVPSILAADFRYLGAQIKGVCDGGADMLHLDVMDGAFVPNISFGVPVIKSIRDVSDIEFDVHLMINDPIRYVDAFRAAGADLITFHYESTNEQEKVIEKIRASGARVGISIKPATPAFVLEPLIPLVDLVLVMCVEPGFGGQSFLPGSAEKIRSVRDMIDASGKDIMLEVDGGINKNTIAEARLAGADTFVAGSSVFGFADTGAAIAELRSEAEKAGKNGKK